VRTYARRAHRMTPSQARYYANRYLCPYYFDAIQRNALAKILAASARPIIIEVGCGMGEATVAYARAHADQIIVAIEVYRAGVARVIAEIQRRALRNLHIVEADALAIMPTLVAPRFLTGIHLFFPDPWPKKKHHKRRMVTADRLQGFALLIKKEGHISVVSDNYDYISEVAAAGEALRLRPMHRMPIVRDSPPRWRPRTAFETKALRKGAHIYEVHYRVP